MATTVNNWKVGQLNYDKVKIEAAGWKEKSPHLGAPYGAAKTDAQDIYVQDWNDIVTVRASFRPSQTAFRPPLEHLFTSLPQTHMSFCSHRNTHSSNLREGFLRNE